MTNRQRIQISGCIQSNHRFTLLPVLELLQEADHLAWFEFLLEQQRLRIIAIAEGYQSGIPARELKSRYHSAICKSEHLDLDQAPWVALLLNFYTNGL